jgi:hypothetical protein
MRYAIICFSLAGLLLIAFAVSLRGRMPAPPDVGFSHKCEVPTASSNVQVRRQSGRHLLGMSISHFDPERTIDQAGHEFRMLL